MDEENTAPDPEEDESQTEASAQVAPPLVAIPPTQPAPAAAPGVSAAGAAPQAPVNPDLVPLTSEQAANRAMWRRLQYETANQPVAQTEQAVAAALRFQAQRQYQQDLSKGMSPGEALAKSAPLMFGSPKQGSLGQAASFIRATKPANATPINAGGVLYRQNPDGTVTALTPPRVSVPKANEFDLAEYRSILGQITATQKAIDENPDGAEADALRNKAFYLSRQLQGLRQRAAQGGAARPAKPAANGARVRVRAPNGKFGSIPASQLQDAVAQGYSQVK